MSRECPVCRVLLNRIKIKPQLEIDFCPSCRGIWFDKGELGETYHHNALPDGLQLEIPNLARDQVVCQACGVCNSRSRKKCESCGATLKFLCPVCRKQMDAMQIGNVVIDGCKTCQGVWLDGGELEALFEEFKQRKQAELTRAREHRDIIAPDLAAWAAIESLDTLPWTPELVYKTGEVVADAATQLPGAVADAAGAAFEGVSHLPEVAGHVAEGAAAFAGHAADMAGDVFAGAAHLAGEIPEVAGAVAEAGVSFIETLFDLIASIFDR
jgi:Zn-finger nucleic acid-binding protein